MRSNVMHHEEGEYVLLRKAETQAAQADRHINVRAAWLVEAA